MPTYHNLLTTAYSELDLTLMPHGTSGDTLATERRLTEATATVTDATAYTIGELVTETDSAITGRVYWRTATVLGLIGLSGLLVGGKTLTGADSHAAQIPSSVANLLAVTAATPVYTPVTAAHVLTSSGPGNDQTVYLRADTTHLRVRAGVAQVTLCNETSAAIIQVLLAGQGWTTPVERRIAKIVAQFAAAGTCVIEEYQTSYLIDG